MMLKGQKIVGFRNLTERDGNWTGAFNFSPVIVLFYRFVEFVAEAMLAHVAKITSLTPSYNDERLKIALDSNSDIETSLPGFECVVRCEEKYPAND